MDKAHQKAPAPLLIVGSSNMDLTIRAERLPGPSETLLGGDYTSYPGGKGANQAVGLARLGAEVRFLSRVGRDHYGQQLLEHMEHEGVDTTWVEAAPDAPTGLAMITVDEAGTRSVVVSPGAANGLDEASVENFLQEAPAGALLLTQLEIPAATVAKLFRLCRRRDLRTLLNASPAVALPDEVLRLTDLLVLNQAELKALSGSSAQHMETAAAAARKLLARGVGTVLVSMGARGALVVRGKDTWPPWREGEEPVRFIRGFKLEVTDSNVASSAFIAGLAAKLNAAPEDLDEAVHHGLAAMALSMTLSGGQASLPRAAQVEAFLRSGQAEDSEPPDQAARRRRLARHATAIRRRIIRMLYAARSGHPGGSLSIVEVLTALYFHAMDYNPRQPRWPSRDRLVLSKGHAAPALYSALIEAGFLDRELEGELRKFGSPLQGHPDRKRCPGVDMSSGSLGQGLSVANGMALAARHTGRGNRVYCILGDGEIQEGQVWEAAMTSAHYKLDNLCAVVDYNALQIDGTIGQVKSPIEPLPDKWRAFGWSVINVDGHDVLELCGALDRARETSGTPTMIVAHTIKGRGVSFMEGVIEYHGSTLTEDEVRLALAELGEDEEVRS